MSLTRFPFHADITSVTGFQAGKAVLTIVADQARFQFAFTEDQLDLARAEIDRILVEYRARRTANTAAAANPDDFVEAPCDVRC